MPRTSKTDYDVNKVSPDSLRGFLAPRYWTTWIGIGLLILIAWLPHQIRLACGALLGRLIYWFGRERRYITAVNIKLCFPDLSEAEQADLVKRAFIDSGMGLIETASGWVRSSAHFKKMVVWKNPEVLLQAKAEGRGVLLLGAHYSTLDLGANLLAPFCPFAVTYRPHRNPLFNAFMYRGRLSNCEKVFDRYDIRGAFRHLKKGGVLWYAPDQDYGPEHAVFAPFFGNRAATITAPVTFASINNSPVLIARQTRLSGGKGYELEIVRVPDTYPCGDAVADATLINSYLEAAIRHAPEQYLWMHKRFKTQPGGKPESPYINIRSPIVKLNEERYAKLMSGRRPEADHDPDQTYLRMESGLSLRLLPGDMKRFPAVGICHHIDRLSKALRMRGIDTLTIDKWFRLPDRKTTALLCHLPQGESLEFHLHRADTPDWSIIGKFLLQCHEQGVNLEAVEPGSLILTHAGCALAYPESVRLLPFRLCYQDRVENLRHFSAALSRLKPDVREEILFDAYLQNCTDIVRRNVKTLLFG